MMKFELPRGQVVRIALYCVIVLAGVVFNHPLLRGFGIGCLVTALVVVFFTARR